MTIKQAIGGGEMAKIHNRLRGSWRNIVNLPISTVNIQAGHDWYAEANTTAHAIGVLAGYIGAEATVIGAGVIAALSPQRDWDVNISHAILLVTEGIRKHYQVQHDKAVAIVEGKEPMSVLGHRAFKTKPFFQAIVNPNNDWSQPVIDRHAVAVYMGRSVTDKEIGALDSPKVYGRIAGAYVKAAKVTGLNHHVIQAMTWIQWRQDKGYTQTASRQGTRV